MLIIKSKKKIIPQTNKQVEKPEAIKEEPEKNFVLADKYIATDVTFSVDPGHKYCSIKIEKISGIDL